MIVRFLKDGTIVEKDIPGIPGKSAYQYAKEGGFTGTEAEFIEKLAQTSLIGDTTQVLPTTVRSSMLLGIPVGLTHTDSTYGTMAFSGFSYSQAAGNSIVASVNFEMGGMAFCAQLIGNTITDEWSFHATELALASDIPTKVSQLENDALLTGSTTNITPTQVYEEVLAGHDVVISHTHNYGVFTFDSFAYADAYNIVFATAIVDMQGILTTVGLYGTLQDNKWTMGFASLATKSDIPTALPTPNPIKFMPGKNVMMTDTFPIEFTGNNEQIVRIPTLTSHLENDSGYALQSELPKAFYVNLTDNGDGTGTADKTYEEILEAFEAGRPIVAQAEDSANILGATILHYDGSLFIGSLSCVDSEYTPMLCVVAIGTDVLMVATTSTVPEALPNPNALTINGTTYNGSTAVDFTSVINSMITAKLNAIPNAEEVAF